MLKANILLEEMDLYECEELLWFQNVWKGDLFVVGWTWWSWMKLMATWWDNICMMYNIILWVWEVLFSGTIVDQARGLLMYIKGFHDYADSGVLWNLDRSNEEIEMGFNFKINLMFEVTVFCISNIVFQGCWISTIFELAGQLYRFSNFLHTQHFCILPIQKAFVNEIIQ